MTVADGVKMVKMAALPMVDWLVLQLNQMVLQ
jgi:hypothetical protein